MPIESIIFYMFSMKLSVLNLHILQVCLWNDCQNI